MHVPGNVQCPTMTQPTPSSTNPNTMAPTTVITHPHEPPSTPVKTAGGRNGPQSTSSGTSFTIGKHLPFAAGFLAFVLCLSVLLLYMEYRAMRHQQFIVNMSQDYDFLGVEQDNPQFINFIRTIHLRDAVDRHAKPLEFGDSQPTPEIQYILKLLNNKHNGIFIESGAYSHPTSDTEYLEKHLTWRGLLIQPDIRHYFTARRHNRTHSRAVHGCLSPVPYLREVNYCTDEEEMHLHHQASEIKAFGGDDPRLHSTQTMFTKEESFGGSEDVRVNSVINGNQVVEDTAGRCTRVKCFPLYSLLMAMELMEVDYLVLRSRGSELQVLETIPFDRVKIDVINVDLDNNVDEQDTIKQFLRTKNYTFMQSFNSSFIFKMNPVKT